jgi:hypothetical protein
MMRRKMPVKNLTGAGIENYFTAARAADIFRGE